MSSSSPAPGPSVSIVVTSFDTDPSQLRAAIASAQAQTYRPHEVIVVDDGSTRVETLALLDDLRGADLRVVRQHNQGVSAARNHGMRVAAGDFLLPLDGDDLLAPGYLAATVPVLADDSSLAIVSTRAEYFGARTGLMDLPDPSLPWMVAENSIHNTSLFRRADFDRLGGYDEGLRRGFEDHEWWVRLLLDGGRARVLDDVLFRYRIQAGSRNASAAASTEALRDLRDAMVRNNPEHTERLLDMSLAVLDTTLDRMHHAESRVGRLEHDLGPIVRALDRHPRLRSTVERARRLKGRLR
ncbi:hypothetical protein GCM10023339_06910 [Alloalcanivorax gelatiniphagus]